MRIHFWGGLGDEIAITGLVRELRRARPDEPIFVEGLRYPELFLHNPHLSSGAPSATDRVMQLVPDSNRAVGNLMQAYAQFAGLTTVSSSEAELYLTDEEMLAARAYFTDDRPVVAIDTWAFWPSKRWPLDRFAVVVGELHARGYRVIELGTTYPDQQGITRSQRLPLAPEDCLLDVLPLRMTAAVLNLCEAFIGNTSGLSQLAAAVRTPAVTIVAQTRWYAIAYAFTCPVVSLQQECLGCDVVCRADADASCLAEIGPEHVLAVFDASIPGVRKKP